jgi:hypothetical protein
MGAAMNPGGPYTPRPDLGPDVGFGVGLLQPGQGYGLQDPLAVDNNYGMNPFPVTGGPDPIPMPIAGQPGGKSGPLMGSQQPITQGTGQLPPGFGELSPIDRSQINPGASMGFGMSPMPMPQPGQGGGKSSPPMSVQPMPMPAPMPSPQPVNRYAPPMAPGVRPQPINQFTRTRAPRSR